MFLTKENSLSKMVPQYQQHNQGEGKMMGMLQRTGSAQFTDVHPLALEIPLPILALGDKKVRNLQWCTCWLLEYSSQFHPSVGTHTLTWVHRSFNSRHSAARTSILQMTAQPSFSKCSQIWELLQVTIHATQNIF